MKWIITVFVLFFLVSCTMKEIAYKPINSLDNYKLESSYERNYKVGVISTVNVGTALIRLQNLGKLTRPAFKSSNDFELPKGSQLDIIPKMFIKSTDYYFVCGKSASGIFISTSLSPSSGQDVIEIDSDGFILRGACLLKDGKMFAYWVEDYKSLAKFEATNKVMEMRSIYHFELSYTGKSGNIIKISYREYEKNIARSSFNQELEFDISEDKIIGFKGLKILIHSASNTSIEYEVIDEGNLNWVIYG